MSFFLGRHFHSHLSSGFLALYTGRMIILIAGGLLGIFLEIFLYNFLDQSLSAVIAYHAIASFMYLVTVAWGAQWLNRLGFRRALQLSTVFGAIFYGTFYFLTRENAMILLPVSIVTLNLYRMLYWIPYHVDFAKFSDPHGRATQLGLLGASHDIMGIFIPIIAGIIVTYLGFPILFLIAILLYLLSGIPYIAIPPTHERFSWGYRETWRHFFSRKHGATTLAFMADGAESIVAIIVWPIFIYQVLQGNYLAVGAFSTAIIAVTVLLRVLLGRSIDAEAERSEQYLWTGSMLYALGWLVKIFVVTALHIFFAGAYHGIVKIVMWMPFDTLMYEIAADQGHYIDEFTVLREMAVHVGKLIMAGLVVVAVAFVPLQWTFVLAAVAAMTVNILRAARPEARIAAFRVHTMQAIPPH